MSAEGLASIIVALATFVTALGGVIVSLMNARKISKVHDLTNSKMDKLLVVTAESSEAKGRLAANEERNGKDAAK